jgi:hypothetical protein
MEYQVQYSGCFDAISWLNLLHPQLVECPLRRSSPRAMVAPPHSQKQYQRTVPFRPKPSARSITVSLPYTLRFSSLAFLGIESSASAKWMPESPPDFVSHRDTTAGQAAERGPKVRVRYIQITFSVVFLSNSRRRLERRQYRSPRLGQGHPAARQRETDAATGALRPTGRASRLVAWLRLSC